MILSIIACLTAIVLSLLFGVVYIKFLKDKMYGQYIREVGPKSHMLKEGTPTTGGVFIVLASLVTSIIVLLMQQESTSRAFIILIAFVFFALAGFKDDINKIKNKSNDKGLKARDKLFLQCAIALLPTLYVFLEGLTTINLGVFLLNLGYAYPLFSLFLITGVSNAVNLTDGLDGLACSNLIFSFIACSIICLLSGNIDIAIISSSITGALIGFLYYNKHKAQVFMGDTGSLALGGVLGTIAVMGKFELLLILIGAIYMIETLSVIIQVASFKMFGKRVFKMSPIHHHFELSGFSENQIVIASSLITLILSTIAIIIYIKF